VLLCAVCSSVVSVSSGVGGRLHFRFLWIVSPVVLAILGAAGVGLSDARA
jgi:hypothetical protein